MTQEDGEHMEDCQPVGHTTHVLSWEAPSKVPNAFQWGELCRARLEDRKEKHPQITKELPHPGGQRNWLGLLSEPSVHLPSPPHPSHLLPFLPLRIQKQTPCSLPWLIKFLGLIYSLRLRMSSSTTSLPPTHEC